MINVEIKQRQDGEWIHKDYVTYETLQGLLKAQDEILAECKEMYSKKMKIFKRIRSLKPDFNKIGNPYQCLRIYDSHCEDCMWIDILNVY